MLARDLFARARAGRPAPPATATPPFPEQGSRAPAFPEEGGGSRGAAGAPPLPRLSAVLIDGPWRQALLDGRPVGEGGVVDGYEVIEITPRGVRLEKDGRTHTIGLGD